MRELTLDEIIQYAEKIEMESFAFYSNAKELVKDENLKELLSQLADDETDHHNALRNLRNLDSLSQEQLKASLPIKNSDLPPIVNTKEITPNSTALEILEIALQREKNTEQTYQMFISFTAIDERIIKLFEELRDKERGHVLKVQKKIDNI